MSEKRIPYSYSMTLHITSTSDEYSQDEIQYLIRTGMRNLRNGLIAITVENFQGPDEGDPEDLY